MINSDRIPKYAWKYQCKENEFGKTCSNDRPVQMIEEFCFVSPAASLNKPNAVKDTHDDNSLEISVIVCCLSADYLWQLFLSDCSCATQASEPNLKTGPRSILRRTVLYHITPQKKMS
jgi:hypothetical protein